MVKKETEIKNEVKEEVKVKKITKFEDMDSSTLVNEVKANRAFKAVFGGAKGGSAEVTLVGKLRAENPDLKGEELVIEVYKGLLGLVDKARASKNRENENKAKIAKASK